MSGDGERLRRATTRVLSLAMVAIGVALIARTVAAGGGALAYGIVVGALFVVAGAARLWLTAHGGGHGERRGGGRSRRGGGRGDGPGRRGGGGG